MQSGAIPQSTVGCSSKERQSFIADVLSIKDICTLPHYADPTPSTVPASGESSELEMAKRRSHCRSEGWPRGSESITAWKFRDECCRHTTSWLRDCCVQLTQNCNGSSCSSLLCQPRQSGTRRVFYALTKNTQVRV